MNGLLSRVFLFLLTYALVVGWWYDGIARHVRKNWLELYTAAMCIITPTSIIMPPPREHNAVIGVRRPSVCLSVRLSARLSDVAYIGSNWKTKRPRKTSNPRLCVSRAAQHAVRQP